MYVFDVSKFESTTNKPAENVEGTNRKAVITYNEV